MADAAWFAGRLRELREAAGLTQEQLAVRAGVKREAVARWERGAREPAWGNVLALAQALGVSCQAFTTEPAAKPPGTPGRPRKRTPPSDATPAPAGENAAAGQKPAEPTAQGTRKKSKGREKPTDPQPGGEA
jgi:transcriptional regulator with XRE-family HTH domain